MILQVGHQAQQDFVITESAWVKVIAIIERGGGWGACREWHSPEHGASASAIQWTSWRTSRATGARATWPRKAQSDDHALMDATLHILRKSTGWR